MMSARKDRPSDVGVIVSRTVLSVVRILIASYFLASATGLVFEPASRTFLDAVLPSDQAQLATTTFLFITSFSIMVGVLVRPAALLLALYLFWSGFVHYDLKDPAALGFIWRDMALLGAILMIAITEQGAGAQVRVWRRNVAPRRIAGADRNGAQRPRTARPARDQAQPAGGSRLTGVAHLSGDIDLYECEDDSADTTNIFCDLWDAQAQKPTTA